MTDQFWNFINNNRNVDPSALRLKFHGKDNADFDIDFAILQIECRKKFGKKLADTLAWNPHFIFPSVIAGEQSTSDLLARYHADEIGEGKKIADLTAGLGIDAMALAAKGNEVTALEINKQKVEALKENVQNFSVDVVCADCQDWIRHHNGYDWLFIDPARRGDDGRRLFSLADCAPNVLEMLADMRKAARMLMVKASPMLDITHTANELPGVATITTLGTPTECKELDAIVDLSRDAIDNYLIKAVTLNAKGEVSFAFTPQQERDAAGDCTYAMPKVGDYLYEPYPTVMKAAPFNLLSKKFGVAKLHPNTHLYVSFQEVDDFPGERLRIEQIFTYESKHIKRFAKAYPRVNVATRNFDVPADVLRKKLGVKDGGDHRLFAVTAQGGAKLMLLTR